MGFERRDVCSRPRFVFSPSPRASTADAEESLSRSFSRRHTSGMRKCTLQRARGGARSDADSELGRHGAGRRFQKGYKREQDEITRNTEKLTLKTTRRKKKSVTCRVQKKIRRGKRRHHFEKRTLKYEENNEKKEERKQQGVGRRRATRALARGAPSNAARG